MCWDWDWNGGNGECWKFNPLALVFAVTLGILLCRMINSVSPGYTFNSTSEVYTSATGDMPQEKAILRVGGSWKEKLNPMKASYNRFREIQLRRLSANHQRRFFLVCYQIHPRNYFQ